MREKEREREIIKYQLTCSSLQQVCFPLSKPLMGHTEQLRVFQIHLLKCHPYNNTQVSGITHPRKPLPIGQNRFKLRNEFTSTSNASEREREMEDDLGLVPSVSARGHCGQ